MLCRQPLHNQPHVGSPVRRIPRRSYPERLHAPVCPTHTHLLEGVGHPDGCPIWILRLHCPRQPARGAGGSAGTWQGRVKAACSKQPEKEQVMLKEGIGEGAERAWGDGGWGHGLTYQALAAHSCADVAACTSWPPLVCSQGRAASVDASSLCLSAPAASPALPSPTTSTHTGDSRTGPVAAGCQPPAAAPAPRRLAARRAACAPRRPPAQRPQPRRRPWTPRACAAGCAA